MSTIRESATSAANSTLVTTSALLACSTAASCLTTSLLTTSASATTHHTGEHHFLGRARSIIVCQRDTALVSSPVVSYYLWSYLGAALALTWLTLEIWCGSVSLAKGWRRLMIPTILHYMDGLTNEERAPGQDD